MIEGGEYIFLDFSLDGMKSVAPTTNAGWGRGKVEDGFQTLVLEINASEAPEGGVWFEVELESAMKVGGMEVRVENIMMMTI